MILATAFRDYDSPESERMLSELQNSIRAYNAISHDAAFMAATSVEDVHRAVEAWKRQYQMNDVTGESYLPAENFTNFALLLAEMYKGQTQSYIQGKFNQLYDLIQGVKKGELFEDNEVVPHTLAEAIKETLNIDYNGQLGSNVLGSDVTPNQRGQQGSDGATSSGEQTANGARQTDSTGRPASDGGESQVQRRGDAGVQESREVLADTGLEKSEIDSLLARMEESADDMPQIELTPQNWKQQFGEGGLVETPIGTVKMGANQLPKLFEKGRGEQFGMIKPTLENPQIIIEVPSNAIDSGQERGSSLLFVKTFLGKNGQKIYYFKSVTVKKDGLEVSVSSHLDRPKRIKEALEKGKLKYRFDGGAQTEHYPANVSVSVSPENVQGKQEENGLKTSIPSESKGSNNSAEKQTQPEKNAGYSISPAQYTTKRGKVLDMHLVKFDNALGDKYKAASSLAKSLKGWYDREQGGFMMRSAEDAQKFVDAVFEENGEQLKGAQPLSIADIQSIEQPQSQETIVTLDPVAPKNSGQFGLVSDERMEELKARLRKKLLGQMNMGIDPEILAIGIELAAGHIDRGIKKFADFAKVMVEDMGDAIRPYIKAFYNGARDMPEIVDSGLSAEMTPYEAVRDFNVEQIGVNPALDVGITMDNTIRRSIGKTFQHGRNKFTIKGFVNNDNAVEYESNGNKFQKPLDVVYGLLRQSDVVNDATAKPANQAPTESDVEAQAETAAKKLKDERNALRTIATKTFRPATIEDIENNDKVVYYDGKPTHIMMISRIGEQSDNGQFGAPQISSIYLTNGKTVKLEDLLVEAEQKKATPRTRKQENADKTLFESADNGKDSVTLSNTTNKTNDNEQVQLRPRTGDARRGEGNESRLDEPLGETTGIGVERTDERGVDRRNLAHSDNDGERGGGVSRLSDGEEHVARKNTRNNHSGRGENHAPASVDARIDANIKAIELAKQLLESGEIATPEQMEILRRFSGWGGLGKAFEEPSYRGITTAPLISERLRQLLGEDAYQQAVMSANSAYYTPAAVIDTLWDIAQQLGFKGGKILEGSAGIGNIIGQIPEQISENSDIQAVEIDSTAGGILSLLYPDAKVEVQGFEQTRIPNGSVDLAITNVPFVTGLRVNDTSGDSDLSKKFHNIHDFCIAKNVRKLREGGIGIFITSNGTLDNSQNLRNWVVSEGSADFIGAFRLNNKTFGGTSVTSDILVVRKRINAKKSDNAIDVGTIAGERTAKYDTGDMRTVGGKPKFVVQDLSMDYNRYFIEHPERMGGAMFFGFEKGDSYRPTSKGLYPVAGKDQDALLKEFVQSFKGEAEEIRPLAQSATIESGYVSDEGAANHKIGEMYVRDGKLVIADSGNGARLLEINDNKVKGHTKVECFEAYSSIKSALSEVLNYQKRFEDDKGLKPLLNKLNKAYDDFVKTYGHFNKNTAIAFLRNDIDYPNVFSLETYKVGGDKKGNTIQMFGKSDIFRRRVVEKYKEPEPTNVKDGISASIFKFGRIDTNYIATQLGKNVEAVKQEIIDNGYGFEDPMTRQMEVSYKYKSGNVREKLRQAQENNVNGIYDKNIEALQEVMPLNIPAHLIEFTLGSSFIPSQIYNEYVKDRTDIDVRFSAIGGTWLADTPTWLDREKNRAFGVRSALLNKTVYGNELITAAIQNKTITVSKTERLPGGKSRAIVDTDASQACASRIDEIRQDFKDWLRTKMQSDTELSEKIEREYNEQMNNYAPMVIPTEFAPSHYPGMVSSMGGKEFALREHQTKAVQKGITQPTLLAHQVGSGKTYTLITTAMEMRRLGTAHKPMIVVQNATVGQFVASAKELYPNAKILTLEEADRTAEGRANFYAKIRYNDWDMIVVPQSTFEFIPDSMDRQMTFIQSKIEEKEQILGQMQSADRQNRAIGQTKKEIAQLQEQLSDLSKESEKQRDARSAKRRAVALQNAEVKAMEMLDRRTDDIEDFDEMGIDALLIDEAHEYKHLGFATAMQRGVKGIDPSYSKKSQSVYLKTQAVLENNNGRNVVFATGTPISNTAAEVWTFMRYLMPADTMKSYGIYYFDDFVRNFGSIQQMLEFSTNGKFKENNRFAGYTNLPELARIWSSIADIVLTEDQPAVLEKIPKLEGGQAQDIYLPQTRALRSIMKYVNEQLRKYEQMSGKEKKENSHIPLTMYGIAQSAAVDPRLVLADAEDEPQSKTNEAVRQTLHSLKETKKYNGTVAIFADHYQNKKSGFNLYDDIRSKLIAQGVPAEQVAVIKPGMTVKKKFEIFDKVNSGEIRVILGSTYTLGTGVNIQERLHTLIHLDAPNRPMDYTQRNGRILRQGNLHKEWDIPVRVLRMGVEDSLDVTAYQRLKTKGAIADSIMHSQSLIADSMNNRSLEEDSDVFGDVVAQLSGSEYAQLKNQAEKELRKYESKQKQWEADQIYIYHQKPKLQGLITAAKQRLSQA